MTRLHDVLRDADPLTDERVDSTKRQRQRQRVLSLPRPGGDAAMPRRRYALTAVIVALVTVAAGAGYWAGSVAKAAAVRFAMHLAEDHPGPGLQNAGVDASGQPVYIHPDPVVTNDDIAEAHLVPGSSPGAFDVAIAFTTAGASKVLLATQGHVGRPAAILIDGQVVMAPVVRAPISASSLITGNFPRAEAERIVAGIRAR